MTIERAQIHDVRPLDSAAQPHRFGSLWLKVFTVPDDIDDPDDDGAALSWWRMTFFAVLGLGLVAVIVYLYVLATGH
ncbi:MAG TPA: hypothetical protein VHD86_17740 [Xanthobacteraceae bacterium]|nr:hypothetical protein [Xanthobacteraceae bacterium]